MCKRLTECVSILDDYFKDDDFKNDVEDFIIRSSFSDKWLLYSDYCLDDKTKPNDVFTFILMPFPGEDGIKELESITDNCQPKDLKKSREVNQRYLRYLRNQPIFSFSFLIKERKLLFGNTGEERVDSVVDVLNSIKDQFEIWLNNETDDRLKDHYSSIIKSLNKEINATQQKRNVKNHIDMLLIAILGVHYTAYILNCIPNVEIFGWFPDRDKTNEICDGLIFDIFHALLYNKLKRGDFQFVTSRPDSNTIPFYDKENRIADIVCGTLADYDITDNGISKTKFRTVLQELIGDNNMIKIHRIFIKDNQTHLTNVSICNYDYGLVSIITPTWNCGRFIAETIESVQAQTYRNWELIIVDDCSSDNTKDVVERFQKKDSRIKYHCLDHNSGAAVARNTALRMAKGRWIAFLDSDDLWLPEKLERQINFMVENGFAFTYHPYTEMAEDGTPLGIEVGGIKKAGKVALYTCCWPGCLAVMYDAERVGLIQIADVKKNNDSAMWMKVVRKAPLYYMPDVLAKYRRRKGSITPPGIGARIKWHYYLFRADGQNPVLSLVLTGLNIVGMTVKKLFYIKKYNIQ